MSIKEQIGKFKLLFDWTPLSVSFPAPKYRNYRDVGSVLLGYHVRVRYLYHSPRDFLFTTDEDKLGLISQGRALDNAIKFYEKKQRQIQGR